MQIVKNGKNETCCPHSTLTEHCTFAPDGIIDENGDRRPSRRRISASFSQITMWTLWWFGHRWLQSHVGPLWGAAEPTPLGGPSPRRLWLGPRPLFVWTEVRFMCAYYYMCLGRHACRKICVHMYTYKHSHMYVQI